MYVLCMYVLCVYVFMYYVCMYGRDVKMNVGMFSRPKVCQTFTCNSVTCVTGRCPYLCVENTNHDSRGFISNVLFRQLLLEIRRIFKMSFRNVEFWSILANPLTKAGILSCSSTYSIIRGTPRG